MKCPSVAVDGVLIKDNNILLVKRKFEPFKDYWALPGGFVEYGESVEEAIIREFAEETNLDAHVKNLLNVYSNPSRDPRGHTISVVFILQAEGKPISGDDAIDARFFPIANLPKLAFDHNHIIVDAIQKLGL